MKTFLTNLLMLFALALCGLIAVQWTREAKLHQQLQTVTDTLHDKTEALRNLEGQLKRSDEEITRVEKVKVELTDRIKTNSVELLTLKKELDSVRKQLEHAETMAQNYKSALERANQNIRKQNDDITKQNEELKKLAHDHNEIVAKYNAMAKDFNELAKKWNDQQAQLAQQQGKEK